MSNTSVKVVLFLFMVTTIYSLTANAAIYKWTDENGRVHYSQTPPTKNAKEIKLPATIHSDKDKESSAQRLQEQQNFLRALEEERNFKRQRAEEEQRRLNEKKQYEKECRRMRHELRDMDAGGVVWYELDDKGERKFLSEDQITARKQLLRDKIRNECPN